jgi:hypothetical protein
MEMLKYLTDLPKGSILNQNQRTFFPISTFQIERVSYFKNKQCKEYLKFLVPCSALFRFIKVFFTYAVVKIILIPNFAFIILLSLTLSCAE